MTLKGVYRYCSETMATGSHKLYIKRRLSEPAFFLHEKNNPMQLIQRVLLGEKKDPKLLIMRDFILKSLDLGNN
jgi:hypothetical protein